MTSDISRNGRKGLVGQVVLPPKVIHLQTKLLSSHGLPCSFDMMLHLKLTVTHPAQIWFCVYVAIPAQMLQ